MSLHVGNLVVGDVVESFWREQTSSEAPYVMLVRADGSVVYDCVLCPIVVVDFVGPVVSFGTESFVAADGWGRWMTTISTPSGYLKYVRSIGHEGFGRVVAIVRGTRWEQMT